MEYSIYEKEMVSGEITKYNATYSDLLSAKKQYHNKIAAAYAKEGLQHVLAMVINDLGGVEDKEVYQSKATVIFNANGGTGTMENQIFTAIVPQTLAANKFVYDGKSFVGWATTAEATEAEYTDGQSVEINADTTLYAIWA